MLNATFYDELPFWSAPFGLELLRHVKFSRGIQALDIGSGTGFPLTELAQRLGNSSTVHAIDPWTEAMERAENKLEVYEINNVILHIQKAESLPFPDNYFSLIISNNGLNNVEDIGKVLSECYRTSKPDAQLLFTANLPDTMIEFYRVLEDVLILLGLPGSVTAMHNHIRMKRKTREEHEKDITRAGFRVHQVTENSFEYSFVDGTAMLNYFFIRLAFLPSWQELIPKERVPQVFNEVEERLNRIAQKEGQITLSVPFICMDCRSSIILWNDATGHPG